MLTWTAQQSSTGSGRTSPLLSSSLLQRWTSHAESLPLPSEFSLCTLSYRQGCQIIVKPRHLSCGHFYSTSSSADGTESKLMTLGRFLFEIWCLTRDKWELTPPIFIYTLRNPQFQRMSCFLQWSWNGKPNHVLVISCDFPIGPQVEVQILTKLIKIKAIFNT